MNNRVIKPELVAGRSPLHSVTVLTSFPGRVRWSVPWLIGNAALCRSVEILLRDQPGIASCRSSAITGSVLVLYNPSLGEEQISAWFSDVLFEVWQSPSSVPATKTEAGANAASSQDPFLRLMHRIQPQQKKAVVAVGVAFADRIFEGAPPLMISMALDVATKGKSGLLSRLGVRSLPGQIAALGIVAGVIWIVDSIMGYLHSLTTADFANSVRFDLRNEMYRHFESLDLAQIESRSVHDWESLLNDDVTRVGRFIEDGINPIVTMAANVCISIGSLLNASPGLALVQLLTLPGVYLVSTVLLEQIIGRRLQARGADRRLGELVHANISGIEAIASFAREEIEAGRVVEVGQQSLDLNRRAQLLSSAYIPSIQMVVGTGFLTTLVSGVSMVARGSMEAGQFSLISFASLRLLVAVGSIGVTVDNYQRTKVAVESILNFLDMAPQIRSGPEVLSPASAERDIQFRNISFAYKPDSPLFRNFNADFPARKTIGLVGQTGAGKSSLLKLILRFYDVAQGSIRIGDTDIREVQLQSLHRAIAYVPQQVYLFPGTIRENIAYADGEAPLERVIEAAKLAEAHRFIEALAQGYDTQIGGGGRRLSGGEEQRIAIARAFFADAPILLFDEATSSVDNETEAAIQRSLQRYAAGRTTIIVAHRLSNVRNADVIYVMDEGAICEAGTHNELLKSNGLYASYWRVQTGEASAPLPPPAEQAQSSKPESISSRTKPRAGRKKPLK
jgi:ATP-binding cassette, subfamily B, bacterial